MTNERRTYRKGYGELKWIEEGSTDGKKVIKVLDLLEVNKHHKDQLRTLLLDDGFSRSEQGGMFDLKETFEKGVTVQFQNKILRAVCLRQ